MKAKEEKMKLAIKQNRPTDTVSGLARDKT